MPPYWISLVKAESPQTHAFFITYVDNYKSHSDGTTGHGLNVRLQNEEESIPLLFSKADSFEPENTPKIRSALGQKQPLISIQILASEWLVSG
jgi:hypothetical protein